jgi:proteasome accessory factor C
MDLEFESGFVTIRNAPTLAKPRTITFQEGVALLLGLDLVAASIPENRIDLLTSVQSLRERLTRILGVPVKLSVVAAASGAVWTTISQAVKANSGLEIHYHSLYKDQISQRSVMPVDLYDSNGHQYMRAYCFTANDYREFRVDRITSATPAVVPAGLSAESANPDKIRFRITVNNRSRDVAERFAISDMELETEIELSSYSRQWIERSVMASGAAVILNSPVEIRSELAKRAQLMLNRYKGA